MKANDRVAVEEDDPEFDPSNPSIIGVLVEKIVDERGQDIWLVKIEGEVHRIPPERLYLF